MINDELGVPTFSETSTVENSDDALKNTQSWAYSLSRMISYIFYTGCLCHKLTSIYIINLWCWLVSTFRHSLHARSAPWFLFLFCTDWLGWASDWGWKYETTKWRTQSYWLLKAWSPLEILGWLTCHVLWFFFCGTPWLSHSNTRTNMACWKTPHWDPINSMMFTFLANVVVQFPASRGWSQ